MSTKDTRSRILEAAGATFAEHGFQRATIREICQRADVNLASVNYHFGDKQRLYRQVLRYAHDFAVNQRPFPAWPPGTAAEQKLRDFVHITLDRMLSVDHLPWHHRLMQREMLQSSGAMLELVEDYFRPNFQTLLAILDELLPAGTPMPKRRQLGLSIIGQCCFYRIHLFSGSSRGLLHMLVPEAELESHFGPDQLADHITDLLLAALGRRQMPLEHDGGGQLEAAHATSPTLTES